ncbi:hypothetical protein HMPREF3195_01785 [Peptostreptococcus anaerobius]|uniref:Uncharacterized protein n=1 Tax=Peptostreptococcus anaerobius TaxID=1261 RepID=A0A135YMG5_9FIRM|nr:hypothetical protein HMPREF3195_01785 [Peptostreptococcus anaerobius]
MNISQELGLICTKENYESETIYGTTNESNIIQREHENGIPKGKSQ